MFLLDVCVFFFFQAEDGIRDLTVTGVQTCALPILNWFDTCLMVSLQRQPIRLPLLFVDASNYGALRHAISATIPAISATRRLFHRIHHLADAPVDPLGHALSGVPEQ